MIIWSGWGFLVAIIVIINTKKTIKIKIKAFKSITILFFSSIVIPPIINSSTFHSILQ